MALSDQSAPNTSSNLFWGQSVQFSKPAQSCLTLCDPKDCSMPGLPVYHQLLELAQTHVHQVGNAIHPSHRVLSLFPPAFNLSQHQGLFQGVSSSYQVSKVLELHLQHQSFNEHPGRISLRLIGLISLQSRGLPRVLSNTTVQKHHFFSAQPSLWPNSHICTWLLERP